MTNKGSKRVSSRVLSPPVSSTPPPPPKMNANTNLSTWYVPFPFFVSFSFTQNQFKGFFFYLQLRLRQGRYEGGERGRRYGKGAQTTVSSFGLLVRVFFFNHFLFIYMYFLWVFLVTGTPLHLRRRPKQARHPSVLPPSLKKYHQQPLPCRCAHEAQRRNIYCFVVWAFSISFFLSTYFSFSWFY